MSHLRWVLLLVVPAAAFSQRPNPAALDRKAAELQRSFLDGLDELAADYDEAGMTDQARRTLEKRLELSDDDEVRKRLDELNERPFDTNRLELKLDPAAGWVDSKIDVVEGEAVRVESAGKYRLILNTEVGPSGLSTPAELDGVPVGALAAIVYPPRTGKKKPEPGEARAIDGRQQFEPAKSGRLFLRVALPDGAKAVGSLDVVISGRIRAGR